MRNLDNIIEKIDRHIENKDKVREKALKTSREIIIGCRKAIQKLHRGSIEEAEKNIKKASSEIIKLYDLTRDFPDIFHAGYVENASQEYVEAFCFYNILHGEDLPDPDELKTTYSSYLLGLCDVVGELRRGALDSVMSGDNKKASSYLEHMDNIYDAIINFDYPSSLIPIKRKQDMVRNLIEKTRGELAVASCERRIDDRTHEFYGVLDKINENKKEKKKKEKDLDIDIDKVW